MLKYLILSLALIALPATANFAPRDHAECTAMIQKYVSVQQKRNEGKTRYDILMEIIDRDDMLELYDAMMWVFDYIPEERRAEDLRRMMMEACVGS